MAPKKTPSRQPSNASLAAPQQSVSRQSSSGSLAEKRRRASTVGESSNAAKRGRPAMPSRPRGALTTRQISNAKGKGKARSSSRKSNASATDIDDSIFDDDGEIPQLVDISDSDVEDEDDGAESDTVSVVSAMTDGIGNALDLEHDLQDMDFFVKLLEKKKRFWISGVYEHFGPPEVVETDNGYFQAFKCKRTGVVIHRGFGSSTSTTTNLRRHEVKCNQEAVDTSQTSLAPFAQGSTYTPGKLRMLMTKHIAVNHRPFTLYTDNPLHEIIHMFRPDVVIPSDKTLSRDVREVHDLSKVNVIAKLKNSRGKKHTVFDTWASGGKRSVQGVGTAFYDQGQGRMQVLPLALIPLHKAHTAEYLAEKTVECIQEFKYEHDTLAFVGDNASVNPAMVSNSIPRLPVDTHSGEDTYVGCAGHQIDLSTRATMSQFIGKKLANKGFADYDENADFDQVGNVYLDDDDDKPDEDEQNVLLTIDRQTEEEEEAAAEEIAAALEEVQELSDDDKKLGKSAVTKIIKIGRRVFNTQIMQEELANQCTLVNIKPLKMVRAVATRWNSVHPVLERALYLRPAIDRLVVLPQFNKVPKRKMSKFKLTPVEWQVIEQLEMVLKLFVLASKQLSKANVPLIYQVIPIFDKLVDELDRVITVKTNQAVVRAAAARGRALVLKYYAKTDSNRVVRISMVLHPGLKTRYFESQSWEREWIDNALEHVREEYVRYRPAEVPSNGPNAVVAPVNNPFLNVGALANLGNNNDPLEDYLSTPVVSSCTNPLSYWASQLDLPDNQGKITITASGALAQMALDYLSCPATSIDIERLFSHAGLVVTKHRFNLSDASTQAQVLLQSWWRQEGLVDEAFLTKYFNAKHRRGKNAKDDE